jgi:hypothetical protein
MSIFDSLLKVPRIFVNGRIAPKGPTGLFANGIKNKEEGKALIALFCRPQ